MGAELHGFEALLGRVRACAICRDSPRGKPLPHAPRPVVRAAPGARIAICGQAPGVRVHASGVPFSDPSGVRLRSWLGLTEAEFYDEARIAIVPMGFCFPGQTADGSDLPPRRECAPAWRDLVFAELPDIELLLAIGRPAQLWHLGPDAGANLTEAVSDWRRIAARAGRPRVVPLPHPSWRNNAWLKRHPWFEAETTPHVRTWVRQALDGRGAILDAFAQGEGGRVVTGASERTTERHRSLFMIRQLATAMAVAFAMGTAGAALAPAAAQDGADRSDRMEKRAERLKTRFDRLDRDKDGALSEAEAQRPMTRVFERADRNRDDVVDADEIKALSEKASRRNSKRGERIEKRFQRADKDRDGRVTRDEFLSRTPPWFRRGDADRDGRLTRDELDAFLEKRQGRRGGRDRDVN